MLVQPPFAKCSFTGVCRSDPIVHGAGNNPDCMSRLRLFTNCNQEFGAVTLLRVSERLDLIQSCLVQMDMLAQSSHIARLFADDLCGRILHNSSAMLIGLVGCADKVFGSLADPPDAGIAFPGCAEELHDYAGENRRLQ